MHKFIRLTILMILLSSGIRVSAQQDLHISSIFRKYGSQRGVTMVELSNELVDAYEMKLYKSLVFKDASKAFSDIMQCLEADKKNAKKVKEIIAEGQIQSGYYVLPQVEQDINRYILFKTGKKNEATLIYIEGKLDVDDLVTLLLIKKD